MCLGCNELKPKKELIRVVKNQQGEISLDFTGKKPGRGAYICNSAECFKKARKSKKLERAYECAISEEIYNRILEEIEKLGIEIIACGTCLDYFHLKEMIAVGRISNMFEIVTSFNESTNIIRP